MIKQICTISTVLILSGLGFIPNVSTNAPIFKIIYVNDDNTGGPWDGSLEHPYQYIQDAIDNAENDDTIFVFNGHYPESIIIDKSVNVVGEEKNNTLITGKDNEQVVTIYATKVNVSNFYIKKDGHSLASGIDIRSDELNISNNIINNLRYGIEICSSGNKEIKIFNNDIINNNAGIVTLETCSLISIKKK